MTTSPGGGPAAGGDHFADVVREAILCWERASVGAAKILAGTYGGDDTTADIEWWTAAGTRWIEELLACARGLSGGVIRAPKQPSSRFTVRVPHSIGPRPLTVGTTGFRAIGYGAQYFVPATSVTFSLNQNELPVDVDEFTVVVDCEVLPAPAHAITIVYEGEIISTQTGALIADPVRFVKPAAS